MICKLAASAAFFAICLLLGCDKSDAMSPIVDLQVSDYLAQGTAVPLLVQYQGRLLAFWRGYTSKETKQLSGLPRIPKEFMRGSWTAGDNTAVFVNRFDAGRWSHPSMLVFGDVQCDPIYAWSDDRGLNLIVQLGDDTSSHLLLDSQEKWQQIRHFSESKDSIFVPQGIQQHGNELHAVTFDQTKLCYWRYDGKAWHGPLVIEDKVKFNGTWGYFRPRLAVADSGDVHVVWNTQADPSHVVIRNDKIVSKKSIPLVPRVEKGDEIDVEALADGGMLLAYQVDEDAAEARQNSIYVSIFKDGKWEVTSPAPSGGGTVIGDMQLIAHEGEILLLWRHKQEVRSGGFFASGPTASYTVRNVDGVWTQPICIKPMSADPAAAADIGGEPTFYSFCCTADGQTSLIWADYTVYVTKLFTFAGKQPVTH